MELNPLGPTKIKQKFQFYVFSFKDITHLIYFDRPKWNAIANKLKLQIIQIYSFETDRDIHFPQKNDKTSSLRAIYRLKYMRNTISE